VLVDKLKFQYLFHVYFHTHFGYFLFNLLVLQKRQDKIRDKSGLRLTSQKLSKTSQPSIARRVCWIVPAWASTYEWARSHDIHTSHATGCPGRMYHLQRRCNKADSFCCSVARNRLANCFLGKCRNSFYFRFFIHLIFFGLLFSEATLIRIRYTTQPILL